MTQIRIAVIGDVAGPDDYHLGDEAMVEANLSALRRIVPGVRFSVFSRDPSWTSRRYQVDALQPPRVDGTPSREISETIAASAALLISGGGNICATWPDKIYERVSLIRTARAFGVPAALVGQTIGPELTRDQRSDLADALSWAAWVGVRDDHSGGLAADLGVCRSRIHRQLDDAFFLEPDAVDDARSDPFVDEGRPLIAVTLDASFGTHHRHQSVRAIASQLDALCAMLDASLVFVPHVGGRNVPATHADAVAGEALKHHLRSPMHVLGLWQPREVRWLMERAALVVSSRYHPIVFATAAGVPAIGIHQDGYTRIKLRGALAAAGLQHWCLPLADAERGAFLPLAAELWHRRGRVQVALAALRATAGASEERRLQRLCASLGVRTAATGDRPDRLLSTAIKDEGETHMNGSISEEQWQQFERDGYLILRRLLTPSQVSALQRRIDDIMLGKVQYPSLQSQLDTGGRYEDLPDPVSGLIVSTLAYRKLQGLEVDPLVLELIRHDVFREACDRIYGRHASISIFRAMLMNKPAGKGTHLPWHQDAGDVWKLDRDPVLTSWIALDPATRENGCVQAIPGSHRLGLLSKYGSTISDEHAGIHCPDEAVVHLEIEAGDALLLHNWMLHRSGTNSTNSPRRALSACYMDARTLNTATGTRFPVVFGEHEDLETALPFVTALRTHNRQLEEMASEAERYALSLAADNEARERMRSEAERYALSLEREVERLRNVGAQTLGV